MLRRALPVLLAAALLVPAVARGESPRLIVVSWDGAADWVIDRLLAEGALPHLAALAARGAAAEHSLASFPAKTAVSHAALWTGCWPGSNGVTGNSVPWEPGSGEHTVLEKRRGYSAEVLTAEPLFLTAAKAGKKVVVLSATHVFPAAGQVEELRRAGVPEGRFLSFSGFEQRIAEGRLLTAADLRPAAGWGRAPQRRGDAFELEIPLAESTLYALVYDDPSDPADGLDTVLVRQGSRSARRAQAAATLKPRPAGIPPVGWSAPFKVRRGELVGHTSLRLFDLAPDGSRLALYQRRASGFGGAHTAAERNAYQAAYPGFHDDPFWAYRRGVFGPTLMAGGDGTAERRVLEIVAHDTLLLARGTRFVLQSWAPDVLFHYSPMGDSAGHAWIGVLDPESPAHDPALAEKLWPIYAGVFRQLDWWLGEIVRLSGPGTVIALVADHGMAGTDRNIHVNRILELAGLLGRDEAGEIDLGATRAVASVSDFAVRLNDRELWKGGIVAPEERDAVLAAAAEALLAATDPDTGRRLIERVFRRSELAEFGLADCRRCGDLYLDPAPGYYPTTRLADRVVTPQDPGGQGHHGYRPERRKMHAIFYLAGPGVKAGVEVGAIRQIDVAPTLSRLLGIPAPAQATGRVVEELLASPPQPPDQ